MDDAWQIDANAGMSASKNAAKGLKGQKSQRNEAKSCDATEGFTQKSPHQTISLCRSTDDDLFRPSQTPQLRIKIPNSGPLESQSDHRLI
jgi:hypothetical protein